jgi:hypothetical protein
VARREFRETNLLRHEISVVHFGIRLDDLDQCNLRN